MWFRTVFSEIDKRLLISAFPRPSVMSARISRSRRESDANRSCSDELDRWPTNSRTASLNRTQAGSSSCRMWFFESSSMKLGIGYEGRDEPSFRERRDVVFASVHDKRRHAHAFEEIPDVQAGAQAQELGSDLAGGRPPTQLVEPRDLLDGALANESHREELTEREILFPPAETDRALDQQALSCARPFVPTHPSALFVCCQSTRSRWIAVSWRASRPPKPTRRSSLPPSV